MMVFDLSHDRMSADPLSDLLDVQAAFIFEEDRYAEAARKMGLSPAEIAELDRRIIAGQVARTLLPTRLDAMAGMRHGRVYALRSVRVKEGEATFVIALGNGKLVYVPVKCGNLSLLRSAPPAVAHRKPAVARPPVKVAVHPPPVERRPLTGVPPAFVAAAVSQPPSAILAPVAVAPVMPIPPAALPAMPASQHPTGLFLAAWVANAIHTVTTGNPKSLPPCDAGRTSDEGACIAH
jgi:hypothetical protein